MKVLLIVPTFHYVEKYPTYFSFSDFPAGLAYIASSLKEAGHEVIGLNLNNKPEYKTAYSMLTGEIYKALEQKPDLIGLGGLCTDFHFLRDVIQLIKTVSKVPIVLGGGIVSNDAEYIFKLLKPDYAIQGEGEEAIVKLANGEETHNLWYWKDGEPQYTGEDYTYRSLDERPFPDFEVFGVREMLDDWSMSTRLLYRYSRPYPRPFCIVTARSCPFNCSFCVHNHGPKYRARSVANIIEEIRVMYEKYKFNILLILDELFAVNKQRMNEICEAIIDGKTKYGWDFDWMFQTHASAKFDAESLNLAKKAGCFFFSYGLESASPTVLKSMNKRIEVPQIIEAIKLAQDAKIGFGGNLIFGDPAETADTIAESLSFWITYSQSAFIFMSNISPYPGSKIFDYCFETGVIKDKERFYENINTNFRNMTKMDNTEFLYRMQLINMLERSWLNVKPAIALRIEEDSIKDRLGVITNKTPYKIFTSCPYCKEDIMYREYLDRDPKGVFIGTGCPKCSRRIRVEL